MNLRQLLPCSDPEFILPVGRERRQRFVGALARQVGDYHEADVMLLVRAVIEGARTSDAGFVELSQQFALGVPAWGFNERTDAKEILGVAFHPQQVLAIGGEALVQELDGEDARGEGKVMQERFCQREVHGLSVLRGNRGTGTPARTGCLAEEAVRASQSPGLTTR